DPRSLLPLSSRKAKPLRETWIFLNNLAYLRMSSRLFGMKFAPVCWSWIILSKWQERSHGQRGSELRRTRFDRLQVFRPPRSFAGPSARGWLRSRQGRQPSPPLRSVLPADSLGDVQPRAPLFTCPPASQPVAESPTPTRWPAHFVGFTLRSRRG